MEFISLLFVCISVVSYVFIIKEIQLSSSRLPRFRPLSLLTLLGAALPLHRLTLPARFELIVWVGLPFLLMIILVPYIAYLGLVTALRVRRTIGVVCAGVVVYSLSVILYCFDSFAQSSTAALGIYVSPLVILLSMPFGFWFGAVFDNLRGRGRQDGMAPVSGTVQTPAGGQYRCA